MKTLWFVSGASRVSRERMGDEDWPIKYTFCVQGLVYSGPENGQWTLQDENLPPKYRMITLLFFWEVDS